MSVRVAALDLGSDSTRMLVADVDVGPDRVRPIVRRSTPTRLSAGLYDSGKLTPAAQARVLTAVSEYAQAIDEHGCDVRGAVLTSAVRDAQNGVEFTAEVRRRFRIDARVIDGSTEAELTYRGATLGRRLDGRVLVVDVGGGSTDFMVGEGAQPLYKVSTQAGAIRNAARFLHGDPPRAREVAELRRNIRRMLLDAIPEQVRAGVTHGLMSAEGWTWRGALSALGDEGVEAARTGILGRGLVERALERLMEVRTAELRSAPGIHPERAPTLVAGTALVIETVDAFALDRLEIAETDLLEGLAMRLASQEAMVGG